MALPVLPSDASQLARREKAVHGDGTSQVSQVAPRYEVSRPFGAESLVSTIGWYLPLIFSGSVIVATGNYHDWPMLLRALIRYVSGSTVLFT